MRERFKDQIEPSMEELTRVLVAEAKSGNMQAMKILMQPVVPKCTEIGGDPENPVDFASLAALATRVNGAAQPQQTNGEDLEELLGSTTRTG